MHPRWARQGGGEAEIALILPTYTQIFVTASRPLLKKR